MSRPGEIRPTDGIQLPRQPDPSRPPELESARFYKSEKNTLVWTGTYPGEAAPVVYKMYRNRGPISWQRETAFAFRVEREFKACTCLTTHGIPTTPPIGWFYGRHAEHGRYEVFATLELPGAEPLLVIAKSDRAHTVEDQYEKLFHLLRKMHAAGFYHGRMDLRNVLVVPEDKGVGRLVIMDAPQAMLFGTDLFNTRMAWHDLRQISGYLYEILGDVRCCELLRVYGWTDAQAEGMMKTIQRGKLSKHMRNWMRFEFGVRVRMGGRGKA